MRIIFDGLSRETIGEQGISIAYLKRRLKILSFLKDTVQMEKNSIAKLREVIYDRRTLNSVLEVAQNLRKRFRYLAVIGIGGSSLGAQALVSALAEQPERIAFFDNIAPEALFSSLKKLPLKNTALNIVSKSGSTTETVALSMVLCDLLKKKVGEKWKEHIVITTDPRKGALRRLSQEFKLKALSIPPEISGRFSVFTPVGLFVAGFAGVNVNELLNGAMRIDKHSRKSEAGKDAVFAAAVCDSLLWRKKRVFVIFSYSTALKKFGDWVAQLWAESLGKLQNTKGEEIHSGQTPIITLGTTDQHSLLQLFVEGPADKVYNFIEVEKPKQDVRIPQIFDREMGFTHFQGKTLGQLLKNELIGTLGALLKKRRPIMRIVLDELSAEEVGALMQFFILRVVYLAKILGINPFDQPGVELGKKITNSLLGIKDYEDLRPIAELAKSERWSFEI